MKEKLFSINSTNSCKGVALLLLLWCHLFYKLPESGFWTFKISLASKVCVAIFVILSGYGFSESIKIRKLGLFEFYKKRLVRLYFNYWFIALIFVPIGIFFMDRSIESVFSDHAYTKFIVQMTGLHMFFNGEYGYNGTWWYMSVIIALVILFPFIYDVTKKYGVIILIGCFIILLPGLPLTVIDQWLLPFALGVYLSQHNYIVAISNRLSAYGNWRFIILMTAILLVAILRPDIPLLADTKIDWLFGGLIILFVFEVTASLKVVEYILSFLGKHLFNIFLFHSFMLFYWENFIYSFKNPLIIFSILLSVCLVISIMIEQLKRLVYYNELIALINKLQVPPQMEISFHQYVPADARELPPIR